MILEIHLSDRTLVVHDCPPAKYECDTLRIQIIDDGYEMSIHMDCITDGNVCKPDEFILTDFLEIYNYMSTESVGTPNIKKFIDVIGVLAKCDHLYYEPQLTKHMKFIRTCLVIRS